MNKQVISGKRAFMKAFLAAPVILGLVAVLGFTKTLDPDNMAASAYLKAFDMSKGAYFNPPQEEKAYKEVKNMPEYPGGHKAMSKFIQANIKYPVDCKKSGKQGTVYVNFVVNKTGKVKNVKIQKSAYPSLDTEAMRIVKIMPNWKPGSDDVGKAVNVTITLPVKLL